MAGNDLAPAHVTTRGIRVEPATTPRPARLWTIAGGAPSIALWLRQERRAEEETLPFDAAV